MPFQGFYACSHFFDDLHVVDYVAYRNHETGSIFIRTLVATFYKLAGKMDVERLSKTVMLFSYRSIIHVLGLKHIVDIYFHLLFFSVIEVFPLNFCLYRLS